MPNAFDFLLLVLATWRLSHFLVIEEGPWGIARWLREKVGIEHDADSHQPVMYPDTFGAQLLGCVWCVSVWVAAVMLGLWLSLWGVPIVLVLAIAGAAVLVDVGVQKVNRL